MLELVTQPESVNLNECNPLLAPGSRPPFSAVRAEHVEPAVRAAITAHAEAIAVCIAGTSFDAVFLAKEYADAALARVSQTFSHLLHVVNTPKLRAANEVAQPLLTAYNISVDQNAALFNAFKVLARDELSAEQDRALELSLRDFALAGIALDDSTRERFAAIKVELARERTEFSNAVMDATQSWTLLITDEERLAGIPSPALAMFAENARAKDQVGWLINLQSPSVRAVTAFADDRELRRTVHEASSTRASETGPDNGRFDNSARMVRILALRAEAAQLLGFDSPVAWSLAPKMARNAAEVEDFLVDLAIRVRPQAEAELNQLKAFASSKLHLAVLEPWDVTYVSEKFRSAQFGIDEAAIKQYLPLSNVLHGLFELVSELYAVEFREVVSFDAWHQDVRHFTLHRGGSDEPFAAIYCDFFARVGKNGGAWMNICRPRLKLFAANGIPIAHLVCNFSTPGEGERAFVTHDEMTTLFHEMGHCLHHLLTEADLPSVGGISGVEWDAIELPSQFMENFAWDAEILRRVSAHAETGSPLPSDLIARMLEARQFLGGLGLIRQVEFALLDLRLHLAAAEFQEVPVMDVYRAVRREIGVVPSAEWDRFPHSFSHIFSGGYASGYYGYLWAERLSADAFEPFVEDGADRKALGERFRREVLSRGGSRCAIDNFVAFRGRYPRSEALLRLHGLAP